MSTLFWGNAITLFGAVLMVLIGFIPSKKLILWVQSAQFLLMGIGNFILGGVTGAISNAIGIIRNLIGLKKNLTLPIGIVFVVIQAAITLSVNNMGALGWLPVFAAGAFTLSMGAKDPKVLKAAIIFGQLLWIVYDISIKNYTSVVFDSFTIITNTVGIFMILKNDRQNKKEA